MTAVEKRSYSRCSAWIAAEDRSRLDVAHDFQRHPTLRLALLGLVDPAHASLTEQAQQPVGTDRVTEARSRLDDDW